MKIACLTLLTVLAASPCAAQTIDKLSQDAQVPRPDASAPLDDGGIRADSGITGGVDSGMPSNSNDDDDGCALASSRSGFSGLLLALGLVLRRRKVA